ncbi:hypothetical protein IE53DRAFT_386036 [Violaceomyces palustris]|uniref:Uncharacterized protein n=1 Tax=Violaceomyces palustris TaxID=1673888 RepID=A0ACD0P0N5_9BASI|nr:hypothetical protein IE53DRAFT_386036 [Violaceomyces palustris]
MTRPLLPFLYPFASARLGTASVRRLRPSTASTSTSSSPSSSSLLRFSPCASNFSSTPRRSVPFNSNPLSSSSSTSTHSNPSTPSLSEQPPFPASPSTLLRSSNDATIAASKPGAPKVEAVAATITQPSPASSSTSQPSQTSSACSNLSPSSPSSPKSQTLKGSSPSQASPATATTDATVAAATTPEAKDGGDPKPTTKKSSSDRGTAFRPKKAALNLTPSAVERLRSLQESDSGPKMIRIGVRNKGCAGLSYHLEYVSPDQAGRFDERVKQDGVEVLIESKALFSIIGSTMDWQEDRLSAKFVFDNPQAKGGCGCGESFFT